MIYEALSGGRLDGFFGRFDLLASFLDTHISLCLNVQAIVIIICLQLLWSQSAEARSSTSCRSARSCDFYMSSIQLQPLAALRRAPSHQAAPAPRCHLSPLCGATALRAEPWAPAARRTLLNPRAPPRPRPHTATACAGAAEGPGAAATLRPGDELDEAFTGLAAADGLMTVAGFGSLLSGEASPYN